MAFLVVRMIINLGSKYRKHKEESQATATHPLAIQKDGTWFTYGYDITKNICEVFGLDGNATLICTVTGMSQTPVTSAFVV